MFVSEIMNTDLVTVEMDDQLSVVKEIFENINIHHLVVVELKKVFGVVSDRDLYKALSPNIGKNIEEYKDAATLNKRVHQIMSRKPVVLSSDATVDEAVKIFNSHPISCIPIVGEEMKPLGIVTVRSILKMIEDKQLITDL